MENVKWRILLVDDDEQIHSTVRQTLSFDSRFEVCAVNTGDDAIKLLAAQPRHFAIALVDFNMPGIAGSTTVRELRKINGDLLIAVLSGIDTREALKESWAAGAIEFIEKKTPPQIFRDKILSLCSKYEASIRCLEDLDVKDSVQEIIEAMGLTGASEELAFVCSLARKAAQSDCPVLIIGDSGTGKELVAKAIHQHSKRKSMNFVPVNMSTINQELFESQLFGHLKGSFTGAIRDHQGFFKAANGGTLFFETRKSEHQNYRSHPRGPREGRECR
ncbi:MAG: sigma 54-interacting transcriptional regulator [Bdellovibrionota bacterium]